MRNKFYRVRCGAVGFTDDGVGRGFRRMQLYAVFEKRKLVAESIAKSGSFAGYGRHKLRNAYVACVQQLCFVSSAKMAWKAISKTYHA